jgi:hypothetical protein
MVHSIGHAVKEVHIDKNNHVKLGVLDKNKLNAKLRTFTHGKLGILFTIMKLEVGIGK